MKPLATFVVYGQARPKGSKTTFITDAAWAKAKREGRKPYPVSKEPDSTTQWVRLVSQVMAQELARPEYPLDHPVAVDIVFYFTRPKSRPHDTWYGNKPDADKLIRAVGDAGNKIGWTDDSRIAMWTVRKVYTDGPPCAVVTIGQLEEGDLPQEPPEV